VSNELPLTASLLDALTLCPMKYHLYRLGGAEAGLTRRVDAARALHAAVKHCLDECYRLGGPAQCALERLQEEFTTCFDGRACADSREEDDCRATGLRLLSEYHADHAGDGTEGVRVEVTLEGPIGEEVYRARADRREGRPDGSLAYLLYTTARHPPTPGPLQEDLRTGILQLLAEETEQRPVEVELHALRRRRIIDATKTPDALAALRDRLAQLARSARALTDPPPLKGRHCRWCHVRGVCPAQGKR